MEWRWIKNFLILIFILLNCFLGYKVYLRNQNLNVSAEVINSINEILASRGIKYSMDLTKITISDYMRKIVISNNEIEGIGFIPKENISDNKNIYIGRSRKIVALPIIIANFLRDTKLENSVINNITLGYYPEISQIDKTILSGEAIPAWLIILDDGREYIYNAYLGEQMSAR